jgi:hypothetical protein
VDRETIETVQAMAGKYKYGWETEIEMDYAPKGLNEDIVRLISEKNGEPEWMLDWRLAAYRRWVQMEEPTGRWSLPRDRLSGPVLLRQAQEHGRQAEVAGRGRPEAAGDLRQAGHPAEGADASGRCRRGEEPRKVAVDAVFDSVSVGTTFKAELAKAGVIFCSISEAVREHPELVKKYLGSVVPQSDNFFATLNSAVFSDGSFVYIPPGRALPDGAVDLFPHQCREHRPVRAHADHRRQGVLRQLSGRLHRAQARHHQLARRGGGDRDPGRCRGEVFHRPELVSGRRGRPWAASTTSSPSAPIAGATGPR